MYYTLLNPLHYHSYPLFNPPHLLSFHLLNPLIGKVLHSRLTTQKYNNINPLEPVQINTKLNKRFENFLKLKTSELTCMHHISKATCNNLGANKIQNQFVNRFDLLTYDHNKFMYCPARYIQPVLYGWFPLNYLPFCPKIEQFF